MTWNRAAEIAVYRLAFGAQIPADHAFASAVGRAGRSVEVGREVIRFNPLGLNEGASPEAQLWVLMAQVQQELGLRGRAEILVMDRSVVDNFAYFLRVTDGADPFGVEPLVRRWAQTYDLFVRLLPDVDLLADGVRWTNDAFRDEIEAILDRILPIYVADDRLVRLPGEPGDRVVRLDGPGRAPGPRRGRDPPGSDSRLARPMDDRERALRRASEIAFEFLAGLPERPVGARDDDAALVDRLGGPLPEDGEDPEAVVAQMARDFEPGLVAQPGRATTGS